MKVTIITVAFNSEETIEHTIRSVLNQRYKNIEYIIIDGESTDNTVDIIRSYNSYDIKLISERDSGIYDGINKGLKLATGDIIGLLNSDDYFTHQNVISDILNHFISNPQLKSVFADVAFVNSSNTLKIIRHYSSKHFKPWMFRFGFQPAHPTFYIRREVIDEVGYYRTDLRIAGDFDFMLRVLLKHGINYKYVSDLWVIMRTGGASTSGLRSLHKLNEEILYSCQFNSVYSNKIFIYLKYLFKWRGFLFKKYNKNQSN